MIEEPTSSPQWNPGVKLSVGFLYVVGLIALGIYFHDLVGPLLLAFLISFILLPASTKIAQITKFSWKLSVSLIFLLLLCIIIAIIALAGMLLVAQLRNILTVLTNLLINLPELIAELTSRRFVVGPFQIDFGQFDLQNLSQQLTVGFQTLLGGQVIRSEDLSTMLWEQ